MKKSEKIELYNAFVANTKKRFTPLNKDGFYLRVHKGVLIIETTYYYKSEMYGHSYSNRYYFAKGVAFSCTYDYVKNIWKVQGDKFTNLRKDCIFTAISPPASNTSYRHTDRHAVQLGIKSFRETIFEFWNKLYPEWKLVNYKSTREYESHKYIMMLVRLMKNPALSLVHNELGHSWVVALGNYARQTNNIYGITAHANHNNYLELFDFNATNTKNFLRCSTSIYQWIKKYNINCHKAGVIKAVFDGDWEFGRLAHGDRIRTRWYNILDMSDRGKDFIRYYRKLEDLYGDFEADQLISLFDDTLHMNREIRLYNKIDFIYNRNRIHEIHDRVMNEYNVISENKKSSSEKDIQKSIDDKFKLIADRYSDMFIEIGSYHFSLPKTRSELNKDGKVQTHCVASRWSKIVNEECIIIFMRKEPNVPLLTVQLNLPNYNMVESRGYGNRELKLDEMTVLNEYVKMFKDKYYGGVWKDYIA